jgi:hypothetical protein
MSIDTVAMQISTVGVEPCLGTTHVGTYALNQSPEPARMIHLDQMRNLVRCEIFKNEGRR